jgi:hypothetical protein
MEMKSSFTRGKVERNFLVSHFLPYIQVFGKEALSALRGPFEAAWRAAVLVDG